MPGIETGHRSGHRKYRAEMTRTEGINFIKSAIIAHGFGWTGLLKKPQNNRNHWHFHRPHLNFHRESCFHTCSQEAISSAPTNVSPTIITCNKCTIYSSWLCWFRSWFVIGQPSRCTVEGIELLTHSFLSPLIDDLCFRIF
jgi:hypothetical protein